MAQVTIPNRPAGTDPRSVATILADFDAITTQVNGNLDSTNIANSLAQSAGVNTGTQVVKGKSIIAASETTAATAVYSYLTTPDRVQNVVLSTDGLLEVWFWATASDSTTAAAGAAALFLNGIQLQAWASGGPPTLAVAQEGSIFNASGANSLQRVFSTPGIGAALPGLAGFAPNNNSSMGADSTTGLAGANGFGPVYIQAAAGTYEVGVKWKGFAAPAAQVTALNRKLWVRARSFA